MKITIEPNKPCKISNRNKAFRWTLASVFMFLGCVIFFAVIWVLQEFNFVSLDILLFQMTLDTDGANTDFLPKVLLSSIVPSLIVVAACWLILGNWAKQDIVLNYNKKGEDKKMVLYPFWFIKRNILPVSAVVASVIAIIGLLMIGVVDVFVYALGSSNFIEDNYVDPRSISMQFPEEKKNLIYIYLESMENTFMSKEDGGAMEINAIPELTKLLKEDDKISFSNTDKFGGPYQESKASWTIASTVAQTSGLPLLIPYEERNKMGIYDDFLPGAYTLGDILEKEGYNQSYVIGSRAAFGGRLNYFTQHGNYNIKDFLTAKEDGIIPTDYDNRFWGMEDHYMYEYAKHEVLELAAKGEPFNLTMLTVDTHFPYGYYCRYCDQKGMYKDMGYESYERNLTYAVRCASRQAYEFICWLTWQDFYQDTVIVLIGDHLNMSKEYFEQFGDYNRTMYNCIINSQVTTDNVKNRDYSVMDMFPTTLAAMGVDIEGERLGVGVNLFSNQPTLAEELGINKVSKELSRGSKFFDNNILVDPNKKTDTSQTDTTSTGKKNYTYPTD